MSQDNKYEQFYLQGKDGILNHPAYNEDALRKFALGDIDGTFNISRGNVQSKARYKNSSGSQVKRWNMLTGSNTIERFGGDGTDGELNIQSGTTTINASNAVIVVKQYSRISITGTAKITISNPASSGTILVLKSQGDVTITSSTSPAVDMKGMGGAAGAAVGPGNRPGSDGTTGKGNTANAPSGSAGGATSGTKGTASGINLINGLGHPIVAVPGGGGASGGYGQADTGQGGNSGAGASGGGAIVIECGGRFRCTSTFSAAGNAGGNYSGSGGGIGGGGGGGGGTIVVLYNDVVVDTGTYTVSGGGAGSGSGAGNNNYYGGGGGASLLTSGNDGGANGGSGGAGGLGQAVRMKNKWIA